MFSDDSEILVSQGVEALSKENHQVALDCLERAVKMRRTPMACSCLAYCLAKVRRNYSEAVPMAREALDLEPENPLY